MIRYCIVTDSVQCCYFVFTDETRHQVLALNLTVRTATEEYYR